MRPHARAHTLSITGGLGLARIVERGRVCVGGDALLRAVIRTDAHPATGAGPATACQAFAARSAALAQPEPGGSALAGPRGLGKTASGLLALALAQALGDLAQGFGHLLEIGAFQGLGEVVHLLRESVHFFLAELALELVNRSRHLVEMLEGRFPVLLGKRRRERGRQVARQLALSAQLGRLILHLLRKLFQLAVRCFLRLLGEPVELLLEFAITFLGGLLRHLPGLGREPVAFGLSHLLGGLLCRLHSSGRHSFLQLLQLFVHVLEAQQRLLAVELAMLHLEGELSQLARGFARLGVVGLVGLLPQLLCQRLDLRPILLQQGSLLPFLFRDQKRWDRRQLHGEQHQQQSPQQPGRAMSSERVGGGGRRAHQMRERIVDHRTAHAGRVPVGGQLDGRGEAVAQAQALVHAGRYDEVRKAPGESGDYGDHQRGCNEHLRQEQG